MAAQDKSEKKLAEISLRDIEQGHVPEPCAPKGEECQEYNDPNYLQSRKAVLDTIPHTTFLSSVDKYAMYAALGLFGVAFGAGFGLATILLMTGALLTCAAGMYANYQTRKISEPLYMWHNEQKQVASSKMHGRHTYKEVAQALADQLELKGKDKTSAKTAAADSLCHGECLDAKDVKGNEWQEKVGGARAPMENWQKQVQAPSAGASLAKA